MLLARIRDYITEQPKGAIIAHALALTGVIALIEHALGHRLVLAILYLLPIVMVTWAVGRNAGVAFSLLATAIWVTTVALSSRTYAHVVYFHVESLIRLATFLLFVVLLSKLKEALGSADAALSRSEERYRTLVASLPHGVLEIDLTGQILLANPMLHYLLGYADGVLIGHPVDRLVGDLHALLTTPGASASYAGYLARRDASSVEVRFDWVARRDDASAPISYVGV